MPLSTYGSSRHLSSAKLIFYYGFLSFFLTSAPYIRFCCLSTYLSILFQLIESQSVVSDDTDTQILLFAEFLKLITLLLIIMQKNIKIFVYIEVVYLPKVGSVSTPYLKVIFFFRLLLVSVMVYMLIIIPIVFRLLTALCFLRNPLPATHMYIIHIQPTPDFRVG